MLITIPTETVPTPMVPTPTKHIKAISQTTNKWSPHALMITLKRSCWVSIYPKINSKPSLSILTQSIHVGHLPQMVSLYMLTFQLSCAVSCIVVFALYQRPQSNRTTDEMLGPYQMSSPQTLLKWLSEVQHLTGRCPSHHLPSLAPCQCHKIGNLKNIPMQTSVPRMTSHPQIDWHAFPAAKQHCERMNHDD